MYKLGFMCLLGLVNLARTQSNVNCPSECVCYGTDAVTVRCMFLQLHTIPSSFPVNTAVL